ncbi:5-(carboxyamino)imidazole ribonucleotide mutase [Halobacterium litoreum]|uniref:N5-carboxyaminoimidazole ribonucleotide mutase n=1 Tax=Halobacterium litoreum TaxID=2039234 RepID=A0ABD5NHJ4_9EURY|nr:5-(carboxyamino)imidazole ribonucleotide mutase [Halobacterium litoreum]UHH12381.1 5-(carboxyamino)imidazole ribonucleotide mutase [Halobacterium litoreum]
MTTVTDLVDLFESEADRDRPSEETPDVGIVMGSDSDLDVMMGTEDEKGAYDALTDLGFAEVTDYDDAPVGYSFETWVVSAHRTPDLMYAYAETAADRGLDVIIAGAGGKSADLPNMTASLAYPIPVVGVPVQEKSVDSVIGMPTGAPITAVDAGKSYNAGLSAVQMLATDDDELARRLRDLHADQSAGVADVSRELHERGTPEFRASRD